MNGPLPTEEDGEIGDFSLTADGGRVFYSAQQSETYELFAVPVDRSSIPVRIDSGGSQLTRAPDGSRFVYVADGPELRSVIADGSSSPVTLHASAAFDDVRVSADGQWVGYLVGDQLNTTRIDGSSPPVAFATEPSPWEWRISPDSTRVVYRELTPSTTRYELYTQPIDGGSPPLKLNGPLVAGGNVRNFVFTADGTNVVYAADELTDELFELFVVPADGSAPPLRVSHGANIRANDGDFSVSPDGVRALYQLASGRWDLYSVPIDGSAPAIKLNGGVRSGAVRYPAVSPDSSWVLYTANQNGHPNVTALFRAPLEGGTAAVRLSRDTDRLHEPPRWSPDGQRAVYSIWVGEEHRLCSVPIDGSASAVELSGAFVEGGGVADDEWQVSPDSQWVVYVADPTTDEDFELFAAPLDGHLAPQRLNDPLVPGGDVDDSPDFFPSQALPAFVFAGSRVVYRADQRLDDVNELFSVPLPRTSSSVRLNDTLYTTTLGSVFDFQIAPGGGVVYRALEETTEHIELFCYGPGHPRRRKLSGPLTVAGGSVSEYSIADGRVVFEADPTFFGHHELYGVALTGGTPVLLSGATGSNVDVRDHRLSADGSRVVFRKAGAGIELYSAPTDGSAGPLRLNGDTLHGGQPDVAEVRISPDGSSVVYLADEEVNLVDELFSVPIDGSSASVKISGPFALGSEVKSGFEVTPDSTWVVFRYQIGSTIHLYSTRLDGAAAPTPLHPPFASGGSLVEYRFGAGRVVYRADANGDLRYEVFSVPFDGALPPVQLSQAPPGGRVWAYAVSADGELVVYRDSGGLYAVPTDGSVGPVQLDVPVADLEYEFAISPDAGRVVHDAGGKLYMVPSDGSSAALRLDVSSVPGGSVEDFAISPDGAWVAYRGDLRLDGVVELFSVAIDGSRPQLRESGALVPGGAVESFQLAPQPVVVYLATQDDADAVELYFSFLLPQAWLGRAEEPTATVPFDR